MSILTFSVEDTFNTPKYTQDYFLDLHDDQLISNMNYEKFSEFNSPSYKDRYSTSKKADGRIESDFTFSNLAWPVILDGVMGKTIDLENKALIISPERWKILTGYLTSDITSSQTSFSISEYTQGEFDSVIGLIIQDEYISITTISNGNVTLSTRGQIGSTASSHAQSTLVYGVQARTGYTTKIITRYRSGFSYLLPKSFTFIVDRINSFFYFSGSKFSDFIFKVDPLEGVNSSFNVNSANFGTLDISSPNTQVDNGGLLISENAGLYCMGENLDISNFYIEILNTLSYANSRFLNNVSQNIFLTYYSTFGHFSLAEQTLDFYNSYVLDEIKNISLCVTDDSIFENAIVFQFNNVKWGTILHERRTNYFIYDSVPFYAYGPDKFNIILQTKDS